MSNSSEIIPSSPSLQSSTEPSGASSSESIESKANIVVENDSGVKEISFSKSFLDSLGMDAETYAGALSQDSDYMDVTANSDGSISLTVTASKFNEMLLQTKDALDTTIDQYINGDLHANVPFLEDITYNNDMSELKLLVKNRWLLHFSCIM